MTTTDQLIARIEAAKDEVVRLTDQDSRFRMSIPANPASDSDLILMEGLNAATELLEQIAARAAVIAQLREWRHAWLEPAMSPEYPHKERAHVRALDAILAQSPTDALRARDERVWDECLTVIDENYLNNEQAREGNPYRATPTEGATE